MQTTTFPVKGTWAIGKTTATGGTAYAALIPPFSGTAGGSPLVYTSTILPGSISGVTKISSLYYTNGATIHTVAFMRPLNWTTVASAAAVNQAVINLTADPGVYSTNYKYKSPLSTGTAAVADNAIAANDYCVYQLVDGTWVLDTVSSVATLAITMTTNIPNVTGGGVAAGAPFFFFGISTDKNPQTNLAHPLTDIPASVNRTQILDNFGPFFTALNHGDPLVFYSPNTTNQGILEGASGFYTDR